MTFRDERSITWPIRGAKKTLISRANFSYTILMYTRIALTLLISTLPAHAVGQSDPLSTIGDIAPLSVDGNGWDEWRDTAELVAFFVDVAVTLALAALIAHHPVRRRSPVTLASAALPRLFYLYALVGMAIGFLVVNHGYVIGFVVFGIGALLRFRSNLDDPVDTVEMILVTALGLCVGMNLPVMAVLIGFVAWAVILFAARGAYFQITLKDEDGSNLDGAVAAVESEALKHGWTIARVHKSHVKPSAEIVLKKAGSFDEAEIEKHLALSLGSLPVAWRVEG